VAAGLKGGDKLRAKLAEIAKQIEGKHELRVGFLEGATYPDEAGTPVATVAWWLNYGTKTAPPRPFFTNMVKTKSDKWGDELAIILQQNDFDVDAALHVMGERISDQLREAIVELDAPALSPITLMLRKMRIDDPHLIVTGATVGEAARRVAAGESSSPASTKVGVYTGHMRNSIDYEVKP
jgi:hypothetical protein